VLSYSCTLALSIVQLKSVDGMKFIYSDVLHATQTHINQLPVVGVIVHILSDHNLTSQLPTVTQDTLAVILYFQALVNVSCCLKLFSPVECVAQLVQVVHQEPTVQSVSLVNNGLLTRLLPYKPSIVVILSILLFDIPNIWSQTTNQFTYHQLALLYIHHQYVLSKLFSLFSQSLSIYQSEENHNIHTTSQSSSR
jgi:hypothetical protein